ncbi:MAG: hypothetical protein KDJ65_10480 [Anaerolineae bacterium]|nr:hypothetical protein [Anaerolineae bacterium]
MVRTVRRTVQVVRRRYGWLGERYERLSAWYEQFGDGTNDLAMVGTVRQSVGVIFLR